MKAKLLGFLGLFVAPPITIFTLLNFQDKGLKVINIEGSGSLYGPILSLTKDHQLGAEISILPTGSAGGKEALKNKDAQLALTSLSSSERNGQTGFQEIKLAEDPIYLVHKKGAKCSLLQNGSSRVRRDTSQQNDLPNKLFTNSNGNGCKDLVFFLREGGYERSNLNKTVTTDSQLKGLNKEIIVRELPENNFLAFEKFKREDYADAIIFFPYSFIQLNQELFSEYQQVKLNGDTGSSGFSSTSNPKLKKELNLLCSTQGADGSSEITQLIQKILSGTQELSESHKLTSTCKEKDGAQCCCQEKNKCCEPLKSCR